MGKQNTKEHIPVIFEVVCLRRSAACFKVRDMIVSSGCLINNCVYIFAVFNLNSEFIMHRLRHLIDVNKNELSVTIMNKVSLKPLQRLAGSRGGALVALRRVRNPHIRYTQKKDKTKRLLYTEFFRLCSSLFQY